MELNTYRTRECCYNFTAHITQHGNNIDRFSILVEADMLPCIQYALQVA